MRTHKDYAKEIYAMKENEVSHRFCRNCAAVLTDTDICCSQCGFAVGTGMRYCPYCGDPVAVGATICVTCQQPLTDVAGQPVRNTAAQQMPTVENTAAFVQPSVQQVPPVYVPTQQQNGYAYQNGAMPQQNMAYGYAPSQQKSKIAAGILGIFLGVFGVHNFYLGRVGRGVAQLLLTLLSCFLLSPISEIWGLIEGILILAGSINTDGKGIPLKD